MVWSGGFGVLLGGGGGGWRGMVLGDLDLVDTGIERRIGRYRGRERGWKELSIIIDLLLAIPDEIKSKVNTTKCIS